MYEIIEKKQLNEHVFEVKIKAPHIVTNAKPGHFVIVVVEEDGERIPLTIADINKKDETLTLIVQAVGYTTIKMSQMSSGDYIKDILGPLGEEAPIQGYKKVLLVGGGVGIAPLLPQLKYLAESGAQVDSVLGGRTSDLIILKDEFETYSQSVYYASNDGSIGTQGFVTDVMSEVLCTVDSQENPYDLVIAIGPLIMMKAACEVTKSFNLKTNVSLNPIMIDGTGMCGGCRVNVAGETRFACVHGPDFDGHEVDFDEAMMRQGMYKEEEHHCMLEKEV